MAEELVGGCISKKIWDQMCANTLDLENAMLEEIEAGLDPDFVPEGWLDPPTPPKKKLKLSLAKKKTECTSELSASKASRFATPVSEKEVNEAAKGVVPTNTKKNNAWAERTFDAWVQERNQLMPLNPVPTDLLQCHDASVVSKYLRYFVLEARTQDGKKYPSTTIRSLLSGLNRILKESKTKKTVILCPLLLQLAPFLVLVFPKHFSSFLASLAAL